MGNSVNYFSTGNSLIRAIHTAVKGRARYKVSKLYYSPGLKTYLESKLSEEKVVTQVRANPVTGNVLVLFHPEINPDAIAWLIQEIVVDYSKQNQKLAPNKNLPILSTPVEKELAKAGSELALVSGAVSTLVLNTVLLHRFGLDEVILLTIQKLHTPVLDRIMLSITFLGDPLFLLLLCLGLGTRSAYNQRPGEATSLGMAAVGAIGLNIFLKELFCRARPALWDHLVNVGHYSFPSGHAMVSMVIYGFIGYTLAKQFPQHQRLIFASTAGLISAIGLTRLYLGVHWPTDVLVGYAVGLVWLAVCLKIVNQGSMKLKNAYV
ncbi:MAG: phosphoesterase [Hapalosiphonaceae cyanobacterium JJU2]|nr:MAG: phosphoesterase [Hapalosiphonaceae cyanobacterium JJU2]